MFESSANPSGECRRVLVIDDNIAIHEDFRKILGCTQRDATLDEASTALFGEPPSIQLNVNFELGSASQGQEGLKKVEEGLAAGTPFSMAFVDMRMPPGWDGVETIQRLWQVDPRLQIVICTAYSDYSWAEIVAKLGYSDRVLILKKPFDHTEVCQLALALTEKRKLADAAELKLHDLHELVEQHTAQLRERDEQLRQKQKLEALGSLAGGVAHEFNNLLQAIQGYTSFAMEGLDAKEQRFLDLGQVLAAAGRAADVTRQLLNFSRRGETEPRLVAMHKLVQDTENLIKPLIGEQISFQYCQAQSCLNVRVDTSLFGQVLMNLCINARDAMPDGGQLTIHVNELTEGARKTPPLNGLPAGSYVDIAVADTGCGMSEDVVKRAFDPFYTTKPMGRGTGLGLSTVYGIVQQHGGLVDVESQVGVGSTFHIYLPLVKDDAAEQTLVTRSSSQGGNELILVAEDEPTVRRIATRILEDAGYRTIAAVDGADAVEKFTQHRDEIDLLLLDIVMPRLSGHDAYAEIVSKWPDIGAVLCTGYDPGVVCVGTQVTSELPVLAKPFNRDELLRVVREVLDEPKLGSTRPRTQPSARLQVADQS